LRTCAKVVAKRGNVILTRKDQDPSPEPAVDATVRGVPIAPELLEILACPVDHGALTDATSHLVCKTCGRRYPVRDGIPVMLVDQAELPDR
jgi:uncharacterized protein YbaR (Trm112 family)